MPASDPLIGKQFSNYRIERLLGTGGMASVYYAWDIRLDRPVAIKVMDERLRGDAAYRERFLREARAIAALNHPNILRIYSAGDAGDLSYFAMEYIRGMDLGQLLQRYIQAGELMPYSDILVIGRAVANALDDAHQNGIIHRDVKPTNVLISEDDRVVLSDFGLAMMVAQGTMGMVFGSPHYMSPEQARNSAEAVPQSDIYSLGIMLYEMLTGALPFTDTSPASLALKHIVEPPPSPRIFNPQLSLAVEDVLLKALRKNTQERYATGRELMDALEKALTTPDVPGNQTQATLAYLPTKLDTLSPQTLTYVNLAEKIGKPLAASPLPSSPVIQEQAGGSAYPPRLPRLWAGLGVSCLALLALGVLILGLGGAFVLSRMGFLPGGLARGHTLTPSPQPGLTEIAIRPPATPTNPDITVTSTGAPTLPPTATRPEPTQTPTPTLTYSYELQIATQKDDSLFVVYQGTGEFPLRPLVLKGLEGQIAGVEWKVDFLKKGECVTAWKDTGNPKAPAGVQCDVVGERLKRGGKEKFWKDTFEVYYDGEKIGDCRTGKDGCTFLIEK